MALSFADQVGDWAKETDARLTRVFRVSVGDLASELARTKANGGNLPHLTGNLMRSLLMSTSAMPRTADTEKLFAGIDPGAAAASLRLGDTVWLGFQAAYARRMNYGFVGEDSLGRTYNQEGNHFVERAALMWPAIVNGAVAKVRGAA